MHRRIERHLSRSLLGLFAGVAAVGLVIFLRELPSLRRYIRISRM